MSGSSEGYAKASALTPKADVRGPMSAFPPISSALHPGADVLVTCPRLPVMTQSGHSFGRVSDAPSALSEGPDLDCRLTLSINTQLCYRLRAWEEPSGKSRLKTPVLTEQQVADFRRDGQPRRTVGPGRRLRTPVCPAVCRGGPVPGNGPGRARVRVHGVAEP